LRIAIFERRVQRKLRSPVFNSQTKEWIKLHIDKIQKNFEKLNIVEGMAKRILMRAGHAWCKQASIVKRVI